MDADKKEKTDIDMKTGEGPLSMWEANCLLTTTNSFIYDVSVFIRVHPW